MLLASFCLRYKARFVNLLVEARTDDGVEHPWQGRFSFQNTAVFKTKQNMYIYIYIYGRVHLISGLSTGGTHQTIVMDGAASYWFGLSRFACFGSRSLASHDLSSYIRGAGLSKKTTNRTKLQTPTLLSLKTNVNSSNLNHLPS